MGVESVRIVVTHCFKRPWDFSSRELGIFVVAREVPRKKLIEYRSSAFWFVVIAQP